MSSKNRTVAFANSSMADAIRIVEILLDRGHQDLLIDYATKQKIDTRTIRNIVEKIQNKQEIERMNSGTIDVISEFFNKNYGDFPFYEMLINRVGSQLRSQPSLLPYVGKYFIFYASEYKKGFVRGTIDIIKKDNGSFTYKSETRFNDKKPFVSHNGYVIHMADRLYFSGLGVDFTRPMMAYLASEKTSVSSSILDGIVLSVTMGDFDIFARRFFMVHESNKAIYGMLSDEEILKRLSLGTTGSTMMRLDRKTLVQS